jgi:predicted protein tyrosine phosphatase
MRLAVAPARLTRECIGGLSRPRAISLISPDAEVPDLGLGERHHVLRFNDIAEPRDGLVAPAPSLIRTLFEYADRTRQEGADLMVHCFAGISRSPAAAFVLACRYRPEIDAARHADILRRLCPEATPNALMVALADEALQAQGRMVSAIMAIGRGREAFEGQAFEFLV